MIADIRGTEGKNITADYHVHFGQFYSVYYQPATVIRVLAANGIHEAWASSTTSCIGWTSVAEKKYILNHVREENEEARAAAEKCAVNLSLLYRVIPKLHAEGTSVKEVMKSSSYRGFKIHPSDEGFGNKIVVEQIMEEVCEYAEEFQLPVLIHTGEDLCVAPNRFEKFFGKYPKTRFVLAHCKEAEKIICLFEKYENVFGDTAFCPAESFRRICECGYENRMQMGTDFPITHRFDGVKKTECASERELSLNYKKVLAKYCEGL